MKGGEIPPDIARTLNEIHGRTTAQEYGKFLLNALRTTGLVGRPFNETPIGQAAALRGQPLEQQLAVSENDPAFGFAGTTVGKGIRAFKGMPAVDWRTGDVVLGAKQLTSSAFDPIGKPHAGFYSNDPAVASRFASAFQRMLDPPPPTAVYPVEINMTNPRVIEADGLPASAVQFKSSADTYNAGGKYEQFKSAFDDESVDGIIIKGTKDEGDVYIPRTPDLVRSWFDRRGQ